MPTHEEELVGRLGIQIKNEHMDASQQLHIQPQIPTAASIPTYYTPKYHYQTQQSIVNSTTAMYTPDSPENVLDLSRRSHFLKCLRANSTPSPSVPSTSLQQRLSQKPTASGLGALPVLMIPSHFQYLQLQRQIYNAENYGFPNYPSSAATISPASSHLAVAPQLNNSSVPTAESMISPAASMISSAALVSLPGASPTAVHESAVRPIKSLPTDPYVLGANDSDSEQYDEYRKRVIERRDGFKCHPKMRRLNSCSSKTSETVTSDNEERSIEGNSDCDSKPPNAAATFSGPVRDAAYLERRRKNNVAAKKSRDRRRNKEEDLAIRSSFLETRSKEYEWKISQIQKENNTLKTQLAAIQAEILTYKLGYAQQC